MDPDRATAARSDRARLARKLIICSLPVLALPVLACFLPSPVAPSQISFYFLSFSPGEVETGHISINGTPYSCQGKVEAPVLMDQRLQRYMPYKIRVPIKSPLNRVTVEIPSAGRSVRFTLWAVRGQRVLISPDSFNAHALQWDWRYVPPSDQSSSDRARL